MRRKGYDMKKQPTVTVKVKPLDDEDKKDAKPVPAKKTAAKSAPKTEKAEKAAEKPAKAAKSAPKAEKSAPKTEKAEKAALKATEKAAPAKSEAPKGYSGKWVISPMQGGYTFELRASNGEKMLSGGHYTTLAGAKGGIETYKNNIKKGNFRIVQTKMGDYIFQLLNASGKLLAYGADYNTRAGCESALESTRRFAATAPVEVVEY